MSTVKEYFNGCAERFDGYYTEKKRSFYQEIIHKKLRQPGLVKRFETTINILGNVEGKRILDVGCGSGIYSIFLASKGAIMTGIDFSKEMINLAEKNAANENVLVDFMVCDFLEFTSLIKFDTVMLIGVFDYVPPNLQLTILQKAWSLTDNIVVTTFPRKYAYQSLLRKIWLKKNHCPVYFYTMDNIKQLSRRLGLKPTFFDCGPIWTVKFQKNDGTV